MPSVDAFVHENVEGGYDIVTMLRCLKDFQPTPLYRDLVKGKVYEPRHEISNNVVLATNKGSDQPTHTCSLIRAFASRLNEYSMTVKLLIEQHLEFLSLKGGVHRLV